MAGGVVSKGRKSGTALCVCVQIEGTPKIDGLPMASLQPKSKSPETNIHARLPLNPTGKIQHIHFSKWKKRLAPSVCWRSAKRSVDRAGPLSWRHRSTNSSTPATGTSPPTPRGPTPEAWRASEEMAAPKMGLSDLTRQNKGFQQVLFHIQSTFDRICSWSARERIGNTFENMREHWRPLEAMGNIFGHYGKHGGNMGKLGSYEDSYKHPRAAQGTSLFSGSPLLLLDSCT